MGISGFYLIPSSLNHVNSPFVMQIITIINGKDVIIVIVCKVFNDAPIKFMHKGIKASVIHQNKRSIGDVFSFFSSCFVEDADNENAAESRVVARKSTVMTTNAITAAIPNTVCPSTPIIVSALPFSNNVFTTSILPVSWRFMLKLPFIPKKTKHPEPPPNITQQIICFIVRPFDTFVIKMAIKVA